MAVHSDPVRDFCASERERISWRRADQMPMQRYKSEQIVTVLRQIKVPVASGLAAAALRTSSATGSRPVRSPRSASTSVPPSVFGLDSPLPHAAS